MADWGLVAFSVALVASLMLGGGTRSGFLADAVLQLISIPLLVFALWRLGSRQFTESLAPAFAFWTLLLLLHVAQLVPLPPATWLTLSPRADLAAGLAVAGRDVPWLPLSVAPDATLTALFSLIPPLAVFALALQLSYVQRRRAVIVLLGFGVVSVFLGLLQLSQGQGSPLRFYPITNPSDSVGFFANRNHFAALLYVVFLFSSVWAWQSMMSINDQPVQTNRETPAILWVLASMVVMVLLLSGQIMSRSRAGIGLVMLALIGTIAIAISDRRTSATISPARFMLGLTLLALVGSAQFGLYKLIERFGDDPLRDARIPFARHAIEAATAFMPYGAGVGSFVPVYGLFEKPKDAILDVFANRAHNDVLEWWLEAGAAGLALMAAFVLWLLVKAVAVWWWRRPDGEPFDRGIARAATIALALLIAHSFVDYPLRTDAIMALAAFCCALLIRPPVDDTALLKARLKVAEPVVATRASGAPRRHRPYHPEPASGVEGERAPALVTPVPDWAAMADSGETKRRRAPAWGRDIDWPESWQSTDTRPPPQDDDAPPDGGVPPKA